MRLSKRRRKMGFPRILDKQTNRYDVSLLYNGKIRAIFENLHSATVFSYMCIWSMVRQQWQVNVFLYTALLLCPLKG